MLGWFVLVGLVVLSFGAAILSRRAWLRAKREEERELREMSRFIDAIIDDGMRGRHAELADQLRRVDEKYGVRLREMVN